MSTAAHYNTGWAVFTVRYACYSANDDSRQPASLTRLN